MHAIELKLFDYRYFPYELQLAEREISQLLRIEPSGLKRIPQGFSVDCAFDVGSLNRLTYVREVVSFDGRTLVPVQAALEAPPEGLSRTRRQNTRYSAHGIHDYRGKFNPQIARAVTNLLALPVTAKLWDPFCGSGTVILEALHDGRSALGTDKNPLAVLIANAKLDAMRSAPEKLRQANEAFISVLSGASRLEESGITPKAVDKLMPIGWLDTLPNSEYLQQWFPYPVLAQLAYALAAIRKVVPRSLQRLFRVFASQVSRDVSLQDPGDLRIRRRSDASANYSALTRIAEHATYQIARIAAARRIVGAPRGDQFSVCGDSSDAVSLPSAARGFLQDGIDCALTSPPYATALPYVDTQRLNLALLGLADPTGIRRLDADLLGSRELQRKQRDNLENQITINAAHLPTSVIGVCQRLLSSLDSAEDGFRRANVPALLYRYFAGMQRCMQVVHTHLRRRGALVLVVGPNRTTIGGRMHVIDTPGLLVDIGCHKGFDVEHIIELDAYQRYSMHSQNSIREERLLVLRKRRQT